MYSPAFAAVLYSYGRVGSLTKRTPDDSAPSLDSPHSAPRRTRKILRAETVVSGDLYSTLDLAESSEPGNSLYGLQSTDEGRIVVFGGGYPLTRGDDVVGAIGASGGAVEQDRTVAEAGVERWEELVEADET